MAPEPRFTEIRPRTRRLGKAILHLPEVPSTMSVARERATAGEARGLVVVANRQTSGLGRRGRTWTSVGSSLYATVVLHPAARPEALQLLSLAAGAAASEAIQRLARVRVDLKWPNDLVIEGRKVGGLLVDAVYSGGERPDFILVGIGINGDARREDFPPELADTSTSLSIAAGRHVCLPALLKLFLESLERRLDLLVLGDVGPVWRDARKRLATIGRRVRIRTPEATIEGDAVDLGPDGDLLVRSGEHIHMVRAGDCEELRTP